MPPWTLMKECSFWMPFTGSSTVAASRSNLGTASMWTKEYFLEPSQDFFNPLSIISTKSSADFIEISGSLNIVCLRSVLQNPPMVSDSFLASFASKNSQETLHCSGSSSLKTLLSAWTNLPRVLRDLNCQAQLSLHLFQFWKNWPHFSSQISIALLSNFSTCS